MDLMFSIEKVEITETGTLDTLTDWSGAINLGKTKGGASFQQSVQKYEVESDQSADPEAVIITKAPKSFNVSLLEATPSNLALAFGGNVSFDGKSVTIPSLPTGEEKALKLTTRPINGTKFSFIIPRASIIGESSLSLSNDEVTTFAINITVLTPSSGDSIKIEKITS